MSISTRIIQIDGAAGPVAGQGSCTVGPSKYAGMFDGGGTAVAWNQGRALPTDFIADADFESVTGQVTVIGGALSGEVKLFFEF